MFLAIFISFQIASLSTMNRINQSTRLNTKPRIWYSCCCCCFFLFFFYNAYNSAVEDGNLFFIYASSVCSFDTRMIHQKLFSQSVKWNRYRTRNDIFLSSERSPANLLNKQQSSVYCSLDSIDNRPQACPEILHSKPVDS